MIVRNLTLKVQGNRTCTDSPIYLYQNDRNIHLVITLNNVKYEVTRDMYVSFTIVKPNGDTLDLTNGFLKDGKVHLILESELFDGDEEVGNALCQIKLYDNQRLSSISLPPFAIHVLKDNGNPIIDNDRDVLLSQDELKLLTENELALSVERKIKISELPTTTEASGYVPVVQNDETMRYNLDGLATKQFVRENLNETLNEVTEQMDVVNQMAVSLEGKADISDLEEYATKQELENALSNLDVNVDLSEYATKDEVQIKVQSAFDFTTDTYNYATSVGEQALKDAKTYTDNAITNLDVDVDLSAYALKSEIPSTDGLATKEYVDSAVSGRIEDGSNYATKSELAGKSDINHTHEEYALVGHTHNQYADVNHVHSQYLTEHQDISHLATKSEIPSLNGYATETYVNDAIANIDTGGSGNVDLSGYVTTTQLTTELNKKSNTTHSHDDRYLLRLKNSQTLYEGEDAYLSELIPFTYITLGDAYADFARLQLPTITKANHINEFHIIYYPTLAYSITKNIYFYGGTIYWQGGTAPTFELGKIYEIILTHVTGTIWIGGVVVYG